MKLLLDQNLSYKLLKSLEPIFPGSNHVKTLGLETADDAAIIRFAKDHGFAVVSRDVDFYEAVQLMQFPPKVVWLDCGNLSTRQVESLLLARREDILGLDSDSEADCLVIMG